MPKVRVPRFFIKHMLRISPLLYMAFIWLQSAQFQPESVAHLRLAALVTLGVLFELAHLFQFGLLYILLILAMCTFSPLTRRKEGLALAISILYAFADEFHQYFVPFRSASAIDMAKNLIGIGLAWLIVRKWSYLEHSALGKLIKSYQKRE